MPLITVLIMGALGALIYWIVLWSLTVHDDPVLWENDDGVMVLEPPYDQDAV